MIYYFLFQIDLDTIDVSNLNRQFLFHKEHVGKSKAQVARDSALSFNPNVNITAHHDSVIRYVNPPLISYIDMYPKSRRCPVNKLCLIFQYYNIDVYNNL